MVKGIDEKTFIEAKRAAKTDDNGLTAYDADIIGTSVRLEIPFTDPVTLRLAVDLIRGWCNSAEFALQQDDLPLRGRLLNLKMEARTINHRVRQRLEQTRRQRGW